MSHCWAWGIFVFILLSECIKAFRVNYEAIYVMNPNGELLVATRRRPEHWCVRKSKCCAGQIANSAIFQKVKSHHHDSIRALYHSFFGCMLCINFVRVWYVGLCLPSATSMFHCIRCLSFVCKLVHSSSHVIRPCDHILWNRDTRCVGVQNV